MDQLAASERWSEGRRALKLNLTVRMTPLSTTASGTDPLGSPQVIGAVVHLLGQAGARRIRILESAWATRTIGGFMQAAGWNHEISAGCLGGRVREYELPGGAKKYVRLRVPAGMVFAAYDVNHSSRIVTSLYL